MQTADNPSDRRTISACHVCGGVRLYYLFSRSNHRVVRCDDCGLVFLNPQPGDAELLRLGQRECIGPGPESRVRCLAAIRRYYGNQPGRLLEVGCDDAELLAAIEKDGWDVTGIEGSESASEKARHGLKDGTILAGQFAAAGLSSGQFDMCLVSDVLEHMRHPVEFLREIHRVLRQGGALLIRTPSANPGAIRQDTGLAADRMVYFDRQTLQTVLFKAGFREIIIDDDLDGTMMVFSRKVPLPAAPTLSVIVPAFNEAKTFPLLMDALLRKELPGLRIEIIVVESGSTDGTRDLALKYEDHPRVTLILEDRPCGKGHAVRAGLKAATGDYVLIQDADLEYDLEDYDGLLEPLVAGRAAFVLGSRHGGRNVLKMRQFTGQRSLSLFFNLGHWFFTALVNVLFLQRLRDPFTMFKVFRRDCLFGLEFNCDRFDFDFELLLKLVRKGYRPVELPVNYRSRSFGEGKKVRLFRDPLAWMRAIAWLRFVKIDPMAVAERSHPSVPPKTDPVSPAAEIAGHESLT